MLKFPTPFVNGDYRCLKCPKATVDFHHTLVTLEARKARHESELSTLQAEAQNVTTIYGMSERLTSDVANLLSEDVVTPDERRETLRALLPEMRKAARFGGQIPGRSYSLPQLILRLYGRFDRDAFYADIMKVSEVPGQGDIAAKIKRAEDQVARDERDIRSHLDDVESLFVKIPMNWRDEHVNPAGQQLADDVVEERQRRLAYKIVRQFVSDWKTRAPLFNSPVTISGVLIDSLPADARSAASAAYDKLKLGDIPKRPYFHAIEFANKQPTPAPEPDAPQSIFGRAMAAVGV